MLYVDLHEPEKALVDLDRLVIRSPDDGLCLLCEGNRPGRPRQARRCAAGLQRGHQYYRSVGGYDDNRTPDTPPDMACTIQLGTLLQDASLDGIWTGSGRRIWAPSGECKGFGWAYARFYEFTLPFAATMTIRTTSTEPTYVNLRYGRDNVAIASSDPAELDGSQNCNTPEPTTTPPIPHCGTPLPTNRVS